MEKPESLENEGLQVNVDRTWRWRQGFISLCFLTVVSCQTPNVPLPIPMVGVGNEQLTPEDAKDELHRVWSTQQHVAGLAYELGKANVELCGEETSNDLGIEWLTIADFPNANLRIAGSQLGVGRLPFVTVVTPHSPAARAGIRNGDRLLSLNGEVVPTAPESYLTYIEINNVRVPMYRRKINRMLENAAALGLNIPVVVLRDRDEVHLDIVPYETCDFRVVVLEDSNLHLENLGKSVLISSAFLDFAYSDREIQTLIAHQLAHILGKHGAKKTRNAVIGGVAGGAAATAVLLPVAIVGAIAGEDVEFIGDAIEGSARLSSRVGGGMFATRHEREADYLALYLLERAGIDPREFLTVWKRLPADVGVNKSHPAIEERVKTIESTIEEINDKRAKGLKLVPSQELKPVSND